MQQTQNNKNDGNNDQNMDPSASLRKSWTDIPTEKAKQPENHQDYNYRPQHEISPFR
jgi:hypothetical protein